MNFSRFVLPDGIVLDARRAAYLPEQGVLAVADLHYGYEWTHRARGQIMPLSAPDDTKRRLLALMEEYQPQKLVLLGDIVHGVVHMPEWRDGLLALLEALEQRVEVTLIAGNHDRKLASVVGRPLAREFCAGPHVLIHGDGSDAVRAHEQMSAVRSAGGRVILGHEHPAVRLDDGVAHRVRVPCFLAGDGLLVLPAFSTWAAGCNVRDGEFMSPFAKAVSCKKVAILAGKLLPLPE